MDNWLTYSSVKCESSVLRNKTNPSAAAYNSDAKYAHRQRTVSVKKYKIPFTGTRLEELQR